MTGKPPGNCPGCPAFAVLSGDSNASSSATEIKLLNPRPSRDRTFDMSASPSMA